jgi:hypothetical protein
MKIKIFVMVIGVLIVAIIGTSLACTCEERNQKSLFEKADWVFLAEITSTRLVKNATDDQPETALDGAGSFTLGPESADIVEASFTVIEYFKKGSTPIDVVRDLPFGFGNCSIGFMSGTKYIFFVHIGQGALKNYVGMCTGSMGVNVHAKEFPKLLEELRKYGAATSQK